MTAAYVAALVFGAGTLAVQLGLSAVGGGGGEPGAHHAGDPADAPASHGGVGDVFLSLRFWSYATLGFGLLGVLSEALGLAGGKGTLAAACVVGLLSGVGASLAFRALSRAETGSGGSAGELVGASGRVLLAGEAPARVKVRVEVRGRALDLLATSDDGALAVGDRVLVLEIRGDEVHVGRAPAGVE